MNTICRTLGCAISNLLKNRSILQSDNSNHFTHPHQFTEIKPRLNDPLPDVDLYLWDTNRCLDFGSAASLRRQSLRFLKDKEALSKALSKRTRLVNYRLLFEMNLIQTRKVPVHNPLKKDQELLRLPNILTDYSSMQFTWQS